MRVDRREGERHGNCLHWLVSGSTLVDTAVIGGGSKSAEYSRVAYLSKPDGRANTGLWFNRLMAMVVLINVGWVLFDLTYVRWRDLYVRFLPDLTRLYDPIKGIEDHRVTTGYLNKVDNLESLLSSGSPTRSEGNIDSTNGAESSVPSDRAAASLNSLEVEALLVELQNTSVDTIDNNPFLLSERLGAFERAKNRMRDRMGEESAKEAFQEFWTADHLQKQGWEEGVDFFNSQIRPQFNLNFYRNIDESASLSNNFGATIAGSWPCLQLIF